MVNTSDSKSNDGPEQAPATQADPQSSGKPEPAENAKPAKNPVRRWTLIILLLCVLLLIWYLRSDRVTPFTSQARVHAPVVPIAPEVSGTITDVFVSNNQAVTKGQEMFRIEPTRYEYAQQNAEAVLMQARQAQGAAQANVDSARASLESAKASEEKTRLDAVRMRTIREQDAGAISERRLESAEASLVSAQSRVRSAEAALAAALEQLGAPGDENASVQQALASLQGAELNTVRTAVRAPEDGLVTGVQLDKGNFAAEGHPQLTFIATERVWIQADFTENNLGHLDPGDAVEIVFDVYPGEVIEGTVREIGFGVSVDDPPLGSLPTIKNDNAWLRSAQRYPVLIDFEMPRENNGESLIKVGSQASVIVYTGENPLFNTLGRLFMHIVSWLTFAY